MLWTRAEDQFLLRNEINLTWPWWKVEQALLQAAHQQRARRISSRANHQHLISGLDWHVYKQLSKKLSAPQKTNLRTWVQGAVQYRDAAKIKTCPLWFTSKHILWLCKWHKDRQHDPMPAEWMQRITCPEEEPLWSAGWIPLEPQEHRQYAHPDQSHGSWQTLQPLQQHQYSGWAFTLDATPPRMTRPLCPYPQPGPAHPTWLTNKGKGPFRRTGCFSQIHHSASEGHCPIGLSLGSLAQAAQTTPVPGFRTNQDRRRVTVLYVPRNTKTPDAPGNEPQLRRRQRDAALGRV